MVIEWLKIRVAPEQRNLYLETDAKIWTPALQQYPGFIDKAVWLDPAEPAEIVFVIRWETRSQWKSIPVEALDRVTQAFDQAFALDYELVEEKEYCPQED
ncbi:MAG: TIGR03792 family protein [Leptolyngbya sp. SIO4C1]|nr:TIGR03792 family protein [Leptolyngbya sp. SIO4C1]